MYSFINKFYNYRHKTYVYTFLPHANIHSFTRKPLAKMFTPLFGHAHTDPLNR